MKLLNRHERSRLPRSFAARTPLALLGSVLSGCSHKSGGDDEATDSGASAKAAVTVTKVTREDISQALTLTGTAGALPNQDIRVSALVAGRVAELKVAEGDHVHQAEVVAQLDDHVFRDQLQQA